MRRPRLIAPANHPVAYYHCVSRVVNRDFVLGDEEKDKLVEYMRAYERLYGLRVLAYCVMSNHFHILVEVPQRPAEFGRGIGDEGARVPGRPDRQRTGGRAGAFAKNGCLGGC